MATRTMARCRCSAGWIGFWAGAEFRYGREARDEFGEGWPQWGEL